MKTFVAVAVAIMLSGCGKLGYESKYTADLSQRPRAETAVPESVAKAYYATVDGQIVASGVSTKELAAAAAVVGQSIGRPLVPVEAVLNREELTVAGGQKTYDIARMVPPDNMLRELAGERTKQVQALTIAMRRIAEASHVNVAAPAGFLNAPVLPVDPLDGFSPPSAADDFADVREDAKALIPPAKEDMP